MNTVAPQLNLDPKDLFAKTHVFAATVQQLHSTDQFLYGIPIESKPGPRVTMKIGGVKREMIMFASNDYLNLSSDPRVHEAMIATIKEFGVGAGSSRVNAGYSALHRQLEEKLAASFGKEAAIVFPTGYDAVASPILTLTTPKDRIVLDGSSHACLIDGAHSSGATVRYFSHNDTVRLEDTLKAASEKTEGAILVCIEGAYSMDGHIAKLPEINRICKQYNARLLIDEAHSIGVHGAKGHGVAEHFGLAKEMDLICGTFSKSLGATGGFVAADRDVITYINYLARKVIFSAAFPPVLATCVIKTLEIMETDSALREKLWDNQKYLAKGLKQIGAKILGEETASIPVFIGKDSIMFNFARDLVAEGIFTFPILHPTVPKNKSLFRLALQAKHSHRDLDQVIVAFEKLLKKYKVYEA